MSIFLMKPACYFNIYCLSVADLELQNRGDHVRALCQGVSKTYARKSLKFGVLAMPFSALSVDFRKYECCKIS